MSGTWLKKWCNHPKKSLHAFLCRSNYKFDFCKKRCIVWGNVPNIWECSMICNTYNSYNTQKDIYFQLLNLLYLVLTQPPHAHMPTPKHGADNTESKYFYKCTIKFKIMQDKTRNFRFTRLYHVFVWCFSCCYAAVVTWRVVCNGIGNSSMDATDDDMVSLFNFNFFLSVSSLFLI